MSDLCGRACDRFSIRRKVAGTDDHTLTGLAERYVFILRITALKMDNDMKRQGTPYKREEIVAEAAMATNLMLTHGQSTPAQAVLGYTPRDYT